MGLQSLKYSYTPMQMHEEKKIYCIEDIVCKLWYEITLRPKSENVNTQSMGENKLNTCWLSLNPLTPKSDWQVTSPYNNLTLSSKQVMRIFKLIGSKLLSWIWHQILNFFKNHYCFANRHVIILILVIICYCLFFNKVVMFYNSTNVCKARSVHIIMNPGCKVQFTRQSFWCFLFCFLWIKGNCLRGAEVKVQTNNSWQDLIIHAILRAFLYFLL